MGFFAGTAQSFTEPLLAETRRRKQRDEQIADLMAQQALQGYLDPSTDPQQREEYRRFLADTPYAMFTRINVRESPQARLQRELGPLLSGAQALGALGQTGLLTPDIAAQVEQTIGRGEILPRREITTPGALRPVSPPEGAGITGVVPTPGVIEPGVSRREIDIRRFQTPSIKVKLYTGEEVPIEILKGLSGDMQRYLIQGPQGRSGHTYGQVFGSSIQSGWASVPVQYDDNGAMRFPPAHAFKEQPSPTETIAAQKYEVQKRGSDRYAQVLKATGDVNRAWKAASEIDPVTFRPELTSPAEAKDQEARQRRLQALTAFNDALRSGKVQQEAYNAAFSIDPSFPAPATMRAAGTDVTLNQVEKEVNDLQADLAGLKELAQAGGDPDEMLLIGNQYVFRGDLASMIARREAELRARQQQLNDLRGGKGGPGGGAAPSPRAQQVLDAWKSSSAPVPKRYWQRMTSAERKWLIQQGVTLEGL